MLAAAALLICVRMPDVVIEGRFWAEEGTVFFHNALVLPAWQAVWNPIGGYLNLVANVASLLARWTLPVEWAPYLTIATGLLFQLLPPALLVTARDPWLHPRWARATGVLLVILVPASEEIWLQTLHCQFQLTLCGGIILALAPVAGPMRGLRLLLLALGPLCGPGAVVLLPLFAIRWLLDRTWGRAAECGVLGAACAVQMLVFYTPFPGREFGLHPTIMLAVMSLRHLVEPFLGIRATDSAAAVLRATIARGRHPLVSMAAPVLLFGALALAALRTGGLRAPGLWLLAAGLASLAAGFFGALGGAIQLLDAHLGGRYIYVPQALLSLSLLSVATTAAWPVRVVAAPLIVWLLVMGAYSYPNTWSVIAHGPAWRPGVAAWRADPSRPVPIWPEGWELRVPASGS